MRGFFHQLALALTALFLAGALLLPYNGGYVLAYVLMGLTILFVISLLIARGRWEIGAAGWCFMAAWALIAIAFTIDRDAPMMINFLFLVAVIPLSSWLRRFAAPDSSKVVALLAMAGTVLSAVTAAWEVTHGRQPRALGFWSDPIWSAEAALILGFLALVGIPAMTSRWRFLLLLGPAIGTGIVVLSGSRGPLLAAPVILAALLFTSFRPWWKQIVAVTAVLVIAGAAVLPLWPSGMHRVQRTGTVIVQLITTGGIKEHSAGARLEFWKAGTQAFLHKPLTGYGWKRFVRAAYKYLPDKGKAFNAKGSELQGNPHLHADILDLGVSAGIMGLLAYALILLGPLLGAIRSPRDSQRSARLTGAIVLSAGYAACGVSYLMFGFEFHTTLYVVLTAIVLGFCRDEAAGRPAPVNPV